MASATKNPANHPAAIRSCNVRCGSPRMTQFFGVLTVRLMVGLVVVVEPVLLEITPLASTPVTVKVYVLLGVTPFGVVVEVVVLPQAGVNASAPLITKSASRPHAFLARFPPAAAPNPASASMGRGSHSAGNSRG